MVDKQVSSSDLSRPVLRINIGLVIKVIVVVIALSAVLVL